ncbi:MAG TPA: hypothetical protein VGD31_13345, partial [Sphingobacteriaceae bacterium]
TTDVTFITNYPGYDKKVRYSIGPISVQAGDVISAHFQQQLNINSSVNAMAACDIVIGTNNAVKDHLSTGYLGFIAKPSGSNVSVAEEGSCEVLSRSGSYQFTSAANNIYINAAVYGGGTNPSTPNWTIPGGGELVAVLESGVSWYKATTMNLTKEPYRGGALKFCVPIDGPNLHVQYAVGPVNVPAGSMVDVRHHIQCTSEVPNGQHQRLGQNLIQGTSASSTSGLDLSKKSQHGVTWGEHHSTISPVAGAFYSSGVNNAFFNSVLYAYGSWNSEPLFIDGQSDTLYGDMFVEVRPSSASNFYQDDVANISSLNSTQQVLYSIGPLDIDANQVVEIRYNAAFDPAAGQTTVISKIVRATSPTATTGTTVQSALARRFHSNYVFSRIVQSTAEKNGSTPLTGQYYNVVAYRTAGASTCPVMTTWGELEVIKR